ncbi:hypothetical protein AVEN_246121-1 [Araneus ventricosus]|uniref:Uncharacterized protein n=1 Tax=Araneus ventricosus TaxID=182803 RepID=A0A4Y2X842_ARAVE|nr:hypothetical protein AVEN_246121-1 [Araneus ventricosus]
MSHQAARTTGGSHLDVPSGSAYHRWLVLRYPIRQRIPPVAHTDMSHQAAHTTGGSHLDVSSGSAHHRWLAIECFIRRCVPPTI